MLECSWFRRLQLAVAGERGGPGAGCNRCTVKISQGSFSSFLHLSKDHSEWIKYAACIHKPTQTTGLSLCSVWGFAAFNLTHRFLWVKFSLPRLIWATDSLFQLHILQFIYLVLKCDMAAVSLGKFTVAVPVAKHLKAACGKLSVCGIHNISSRNDPKLVLCAESQATPSDPTQSFRFRSHLLCIRWTGFLPQRLCLLQIFRLVCVHHFLWKGEWETVFTLALLNNNNRSPTKDVQHVQKYQPVLIDE